MQTIAVGLYLSLLGALLYGALFVDPGFWYVLVPLVALFIISMIMDLRKENQLRKDTEEWERAAQANDDKYGIY